MLPESPGSVSRIAFGGPGVPDAGGTHQLRQSTASVTAAPGGTDCSTLSGGRTAGNVGGSAGNGVCRWTGAGTAPTTCTSGRPVNRHADEPALRNVTSPVPPEIAGANW